MAKGLERRPDPLRARQAPGWAPGSGYADGALGQVRGSGPGVVDTDLVGGHRATEGGVDVGMEAGVQFLASSVKEGHRTDNLLPGGTVLSPSTDTCQRPSAHRPEGSSHTRTGN